MKGFGKTMILGMIKNRRLHGYEIMTIINKFYLSHKIFKMKPVGPSTIYPILHDLEKRKLIKGTWEHQGKRKLKYYEITPKGEVTLQRIKEIFENNISKLWEDFWNDDFYSGKDFED
jgi:DNA-binding PadR family transcriptional regulator